MAISYVGNCAWRLIDTDRSRMAKDLPETVYRYTGRYDQLDAFLATVLPGAMLDGGYIMGRRTREQAGPGRSEVDVSVGFAPDFLTFSVSPGTSQKTASKSATVASSSIIDGADSVEGKRDVSYEAPESRYEYFTSTMPLGARFTAVATTRTPFIKRSVITAQGVINEVTDPPRRDFGQTITKTYGGANAPAPLVAALTMADVAVLSGHEAVPIEGTPWFRCTDVVTLELQGD